MKELIDKITSTWFKVSIVMLYTDDIVPEWEVLVRHYDRSGYIDNPKEYTEKGPDLYEVLTNIAKRIKHGQYDQFKNINAIGE